MYYVYILTTKNNQVIYTGVTNNLFVRLQQHLLKLDPTSFTAKYNVNKLVWYQDFSLPIEASSAEKQIKSWSRKKKIALIESMNPEWKDLSHSEGV